MLPACSALIDIGLKRRRLCTCRSFLDWVRRYSFEVTTMIIRIRRSQSRKRQNSKTDRGVTVRRPGSHGANFQGRSVPKVRGDNVRVVAGAISGFMPTVEHIGVSRRIPRDEERARLKEIMKRARRPGFGYIVRTVSEGVKEEELRSDVEFLHVLWQDVLSKRDQQPAPSLLHSDLSLSFRWCAIFWRRVDNSDHNGRVQCIKTGAAIFA